MTIYHTEDPPLCPNCKRNRVVVDEYEPFQLRGTGMLKTKFLPYCEVCMELKKDITRRVSESALIAERLAKAKRDKEIPWFEMHDKNLINRDTLMKVGEAVFSGNRKTEVGFTLKPSGVWAWGKTGGWKSRALSRLSESVYALGHTIRWVRFSDALRGHVAALVDDDGGAARRYFEGLKAPDVLVIDDFGCGKAKLSPTGLEFLFDIIDDRYMRYGTDMCPLWVTSQAPPGEAIKQSLSAECRGYDATPMIRRIEEITTEVQV